MLLFCAAVLTQAQKTVEFRINGIASNIGDMDGWPNGDSDPQWNFEIIDNTFNLSNNDNVELGGTNCPGLRSYINSFFSETYDCDLPNSFRFVFRGFEDDGIGSDANSGDRTFTFNTSSLITSGSTLWRNVFGGSGYVEVRASGTNCSAALMTPVLIQGSGNVKYQIRLQYRVIGSSLCHDECNDPYVIPTAQEFECQSNQISTPLNIDIYARDPADASQPGHPSDPLIQAECGSSIIDGSSPEEVWIRTTIPDSTGGVIIQFENHGECTPDPLLLTCQTNISYAWYTSSNGTCSGLEYRGCDAVSCFIGCGDGEIRVDGRAGEDVWVRIWEEDDQGFHIEINQITPTAPADRCYTAMPVSAIGCNYEATSPTSGTYAEPDLPSWTDQAHPDLNPLTCSSCICQDGDNNPSTNTVWSSNENMVWYTFNQDANGPFDITVLNMNCIGGANTAQIGIFTNSGTAQNPNCDLSAETGMGCSVGVGTVTLSIPNLPAGEYILVVDGNAGAQCEWTFQSTTILALILHRFSANYNEITEAVELNVELKTSEETEQIFIQRSINGVDFVDVYSINSPYNEVEGTVVHEFDYEDTNYPYVDVLYYRLKEVDYSGHIDYSSIKAVSLPEMDIDYTVLQDVHPIPTSDLLHIPFYVNAESSRISLQIVDVRGNVLDFNVPETLFSAGKHRVSLNVGHLPKGVYMLRFTADDGVKVRKFVVN